MGDSATDILNDFSPQALARASEANGADYYRHLSALPGVEVSDTPEMLRVCTGVPHPLVNGVIWARLTAADVEARIADTRAYFQQRRLPFEWLVGSQTEPRNLGESLIAHGLTHQAVMTSMAADLQTLLPAAPPLGVTIEEVVDDARMEHWSEVVRVGFKLSPETTGVVAALSRAAGYGEHSPIRSFVAYENGTPLGASQVALGAGVAGLWCVAVVPEGRRRGIGAALTAIPLGVARAQGYRVGILWASAMGEPVYRRLGFKEYGKISLYVGGVEPEEPS